MGEGRAWGWGCRLLVRHKEVIEAFTICLTGDICFLQARRCAACRGTAALAHPSPSPPAHRERDGPSPSSMATGPPLPVWEGEIAHAAKGNKHEESSP